MHYQEALDYCLAKSGAQPDEPWEGDVVVKVGEKIFAFFGVIENTTVGLKCGKDADEAHSWRAQYPDDVTVMPYLGRYGWNTFVLDGNIPDEELFEAIDTSYIDVLNRLPKGRREQIDPHKSS
jgi:predicted DNA-binding protein (MmcQ/YjbR family)